MRLRFFMALLVVALFLISHVSYASATTHGCAPPIPPPVPGSPVAAPAIPGNLLINEVLTMPGSTWNCSELNRTFSISSDFWVELYNPQNQPYNLYTAHASFDTGPNTLEDYFPLGAAIASHGHLVLFPAVYSSTFLLGTNLRLVIAGVIIDQVNLPVLPVDHSYARIPDGSNSWQITNTPTIDSSNLASQVSPTSSSSNQASGDSGSATSTPSIGAATQPAWNNLQFPTSVSITTPDTNPTLTTISTTSTPVNDGWDTPRRIILTTIVAALALMLFWCWRLFTNS